MKRCVIIAAVLLLVGCSSGQVVSGVEAVVAASEAVIPLIPGISPAVVAEVESYLTAATSGVSCVNAELATSDTGATRALNIAGCFSALSYSGLSTSAQGYVSAVNAAIQSLLKLFPASGTNTVAITASDQVKLIGLQARNATVAAACRNGYRK